jgi:hypothetical protein
MDYKEDNDSFWHPWHGVGNRTVISPEPWWRSIVHRLIIDGKNVKVVLTNSVAEGRPGYVIDSYRIYIEMLWGATFSFDGAGIESISITEAGATIVLKSK